MVDNAPKVYNVVKKKNELVREVEKAKVLLGLLQGLLIRS